MILKIIYVVILLCLIFSISSQKKPIKAERFGNQNSDWVRYSIHENMEERLKLEAADAAKKMWENGKANLNPSGNLDQKKECGPRHSEDESSDNKCGDCRLDDCSTDGPAGFEAGGWTRGEKLLPYWTNKKQELSDKIYGPNNTTCVTDAPSDTLCGKKQETENALSGFNDLLAEYNDPTSVLGGDYADALVDQTNTANVLAAKQLDAWGSGGTYQAPQNPSKGYTYEQAVADEKVARDAYKGYKDTTGVYVEGSEYKKEKARLTEIALKQIYEDITTEIAKKEDIIRCNMGNLTEDDKKYFLTKASETIDLPNTVLHLNVIGGADTSSCPLPDSQGSGSGGGGGGGNNLANQIGNQLSNWGDSIGDTAEDVFDSFKDAGTGLEQAAGDIVDHIGNSPIANWTRNTVTGLIGDTAEFVDDVLALTPHANLSKITDKAMKSIDKIIEESNELLMESDENKEKVKNALKRCEKDKCKDSCNNQFSGNQGMKEICKNKCEALWTANPGGPKDCSLFADIPTNSAYWNYIPTSS